MLDHDKRHASKIPSPHCWGLQLQHQQSEKIGSGETSKNHGSELKFSISAYHIERGMCLWKCSLIYLPIYTQCIVMNVSYFIFIFFLSKTQESCISFILRRRNKGLRNPTTTTDYNAPKPRQKHKGLEAQTPFPPNRPHRRERLFAPAKLQSFKSYFHFHH
jgi:hypothetical protein